jgi:threonine/homoserine/homoserine lactone efflux protein
MTTIIAMASFALVTSITPGPVNIIATATGANFGFRRTIPHIFGASLGFTLILVLMGTGLARVFGHYPNAMEVLTLIGAAFLFYTSYKIAFASTDQSRARKDNPPSILEGALCQWLNPKAWIVAIAGVAVFVTSGSSTLGIFSALFFLVCFLSISVWAIMGGAIRGMLKTSKSSRTFNVFMGLLQALTVTYMLFIN